MPRHFFARRDNVFSKSGRRRNENTRLQIQRLQKLTVFVFDLAKARFGIIRQVHFVDYDAELLHTEQAQQIGVALRLFLHAFIGGDHQHGCVGVRRTRDHVFQKLLVTWCVDNHVVPLHSFERNLSSIDGDVLFLFLEQGIEEKRELELHVFRRARALHLLEFPFGKGIRVVQNSADESRLAVIDVADEDDTQLRIDAGC